MWDCEADDFQEQNDLCIFDESEVEGEAIAQKLELLGVGAERNRLLIHMSEAAYALLPQLKVGVQARFRRLPMLLCEFPIWMQRLHVEISLDVLLHVMVMVIVTMFVLMLLVGMVLVLEVIRVVMVAIELFVGDGREGMLGMLGFRGTHYLFRLLI